MATMIFRCTKCKFYLRTEVVKKVSRSNYDGRTMVKYENLDGSTCAANCACGKSLVGKLLNAYITDHVCDKKCTHAVGTECECSCGGVNHGIALMVA